MIKEKYKEENKMLKSINEGLTKKNRKQYDNLKKEKINLEDVKKEKAKENLEQKKIKVNAMKKEEKEKDKDKNDKDSTYDKMSAKTIKNSKATINTVLTPEQKISYDYQKELISQYKKFCERLLQQEQELMQKIEDTKKMTKNRSSSSGKIKVYAPNKKRKFKLEKEKDMKNRTKSSYKLKNDTDNFMLKYQKKLNENKKFNEKFSTNLKKINANEM